METLPDPILPTQKRVLILFKNDYELMHKWNKEVVDKWIAGLRSGKWVQTTGKMTNPAMSNSACCLMVLEAECNNKTTKDFLIPEDNQGIIWAYGVPTDIPNSFVFKYANGEMKQPENIQAKLYNPMYPESCEYMSPAGWNDSLRLSFNQIADLLEFGQIEI